MINIYSIVVLGKAFTLLSMIAPVFFLFLKRSFRQFALYEESPVLEEIIRTFV